MSATARMELVRLFTLGLTGFDVPFLDSIYIDKPIQQHNLIQTARFFYPNEMWWFQQDNWTVHTAGTSQAWFHNHGIDVIDFPPWSSDLNPIELLWNDLKRRVYSHHPKTMEELEHFIAAEWNACSTGIHCVATADAASRSAPARGDGDSRGNPAG